MLPQNIHYENGPMGHLMVWIMGPQEKIVQYQFQLLNRQSPDYLLPCVLRCRSGQSQLCQDISGLMPLDQCKRQKHFTPLECRHIIRQIASALQDAADRLLPFRQFSLHPSYIFLTPDLSIRLAFWPVSVKADQETVHADPCPSELDNLLHLFGQASGLSSDEVELLRASLAAGGLARLVRLLDVSSENASSQGPPKARDGGRALLFGLADSARRQMKEAWQLLLLWLKKLFLGSAQPPVASEDNQTLLLVPDPANFRMAMLAEGRPGTPEENEGIRAFILVDEFVIGRDPSSTDLCLADSGIGRIHARIIRRAGSFSIVDLGSCNGTCLDGRRLLKHTETRLPDQCILQFGERSFYFQVEDSGLS